MAIGKIKDAFHLQYADLYVKILGIVAMNRKSKSCRHFQRVSVAGKGIMPGVERSPGSLSEEMPDVGLR